jgi:DNA-binding transcriptional MerR regulator
LETFKLLQGQYPPMKKIPIPNLRIGQVAQASGMSTASIRFYEQQGLLSQATRASNGYRTYSAQDVERLRRIRTCRSLDMSIQEIQTLLQVPGDSATACEVTSDVFRQHLVHVTQRIEELLELKSRLEALQALCRDSVDAHCPTQAAMGQMEALPKTPTVHHLRPL